MKIIIGLFTVFMVCSCSQQKKMKDIKDNILYEDQQGNIYLKREIDIINGKNSQNNQFRFFDLVFYKDSTYQLKNIVDIKTFILLNLLQILKRWINNSKSPHFNMRRLVIIILGTLFNYLFSTFESFFFFINIIS